MIYCIPGMAIKANSSKNFSISDVDVILKPGDSRWMSTTADAFHFEDCKGSIAPSCFVWIVPDPSPNTG
jgi:hypothetical protein